MQQKYEQLLKILFLHIHKCLDYWNGCHYDVDRSSSENSVLDHIFRYATGRKNSSRVIKNLKKLKFGGPVWKKNRGITLAAQ